MNTHDKPRQIAVLGLGYVGLPVALAMAKRFPGTIGFDIDARKVASLREGIDPSGEIDEATIRAVELTLSSDEAELSDANFYIVAVPTPIDAAKRPDLTALKSATTLVGRVLRPGDIVVYESTVYPGVTEEVCAPILERESNLVFGTDFQLGYSPERINPGDTVHRFETVVKVVSGSNAATLEEVSQVYGAVVDAGVHQASSIKVAEASKVIENVQRDLNIALMNELALIFDRLDIDSAEVLAASGTKWNFLPFTPGLVGGHCIGVDPYYLTFKAEEVGIIPQVILAGRRINDSMGEFVAQRTIKEMILAGVTVQRARVGILGLTFKENVSDLRNSRVPDIVAELESYGVNVLVHDPLASPAQAKAEYGIELLAREDMRDLDAVVFAVAHEGLHEFAREIADRRTAVCIDVKSALDRAALPDDIRYWRL